MTLKQQQTRLILELRQINDPKIQAEIKEEIDLIQEKMYEEALASL